MRSKAASLLSAVIFSLLLIFCSEPSYAEHTEYTADKVNNLISGIISYKLSESGNENVQDWINGKLTAEAGTTSEWYIITLSQNGYSDFSLYSDSLIRYLDSHSEPSASSRLKYSLALSSSGSSSAYITDFLNNSAGKQGIMSWIYALHVMNNGYTSPDYDSSSVISTLLSLQYNDGGWALFGDNGDVDVTAMTMHALAPYYNSRSDVHDACERGITFLSERQQEDGGFTSFGTANSESASQVLTALSALGINCQYDNRFIKNENTVIDGIVKYRLDNGSFSHTEDSGVNDTATVQAMYAFTAYRRMLSGQGPVFIFDNRKPAEEPAVSDVPEQPASDNSISSRQNENKSSETAAAVTTSTASEPDAVSETSVSSMQFSSYNKTEYTSSTSFRISEVSDITILSETSPDSYSNSSLSSDNTHTTGSRSGYKKTAVIIVISSGAAVCLILWLTGKRNRKNFIFVGIAAVLIIVFILVTDFQSAENYYSHDTGTKENIKGTVSIEIRCDTVSGKSDAEYIPEDGTILAETKFDIEDGETVFDILTEAARKNNIQIENKGSSGNSHGMVYISGINFIYEFDFGDLSGWVYHVNGITPSVGCGEYVLSDGDRIEWLYTCELGHDLDEVYE